MADPSWFVRKGEKAHGPFSSQQMKQLADEGKIGPETAVRRGAEGQWVAAQRVKGLFGEETLPAVKPVGSVVNVEPGAFLDEVSQPVDVRMPCPFCDEIISARAVKCRFCNEFLDGRPREQSTPQPMASAAPFASAMSTPSVNVVVNQQTTVGAVRKRWSPLVAMLLSFVIPGVGQLYKGQPINGLVWFVVVVIGYVAFIIPGLILHLCCVVGAGLGDPYR